MLSQKELQRMLRTMDAELEAVRLLKQCPACGGASSRLINARMRRVGIIQEDLAQIVGKQAAAKVIAQRYAGWRRSA